jgi:hypothetical protein
LDELEITEVPVSMTMPMSVQAYGKERARIPLRNVGRGITSRTVRNNMRGLKYRNRSASPVGVVPNVQSFAKHGTRSLSPQPTHLVGGGGNTSKLTLRTVGNYSSEGPAPFSRENPMANFTKGKLVPVNSIQANVMTPMSITTSNIQNGLHATRGMNVGRSRVNGFTSKLGTGSGIETISRVGPSTISELPSILNQARRVISNNEKRAVLAAMYKHRDLPRNKGTRRITKPLKQTISLPNTQETLDGTDFKSLMAATGVQKKFHPPQRRGGKITARRASRHARHRHGRRYRSRHTRR